MKVCGYDACDGRHVARGMCNRHYIIWRHSLGGPVQRRTTSERFWAKVQKTPGCWLWTGAVSNGYGRFGIARQTILAHRFAYEAVIGSIPVGMQIDHICRVRHCVNPSHLEPVTQQENLKRGRQARERDVA